MPRANRSYWTAKIGRNRDRDERNNAALADAGWTVIRAWEHEDPDAVAARVRALVALAAMRSTSR